MIITKTTSNGTEFRFVCESWSNSRAWGHRVKLYTGTNYAPIADAKIIYYNRTWESYQYQSCMCAAVDQARSEREALLLSRYKEDHNIKRLTKERRAQVLEHDEYWNTLNELYKMI